MRTRILVAILFMLFISSVAYASPIQQYASSVIGCSGEWSPTAYSAAQALGAPNTLKYGDIETAWAPAKGHKNGYQEYLSLGFATPTYANGITVRETCGNGFVTRIDLIDMDNIYHQVWTGTDPSLPGKPADFFMEWSLTPYLTQGAKIFVDTNHNLNTFEEIDSVKLYGDTAPVHTPLPSTLILLAPGLGVLGSLKRKIKGRQ